MAKRRGRPKVGPTVSIRVPEEFYATALWVAYAEGMSMVRYMERVILPILQKEYAANRSVIERGQERERADAAASGRPIAPMPPFPL